MKRTLSLVLSVLAFVAVLIGVAPTATAAAPTPGAFVGIDQTLVIGSTYNRTAAVITHEYPKVSQSWRVVAGPTDVGLLISSAVNVSYTPPAVGVYTIEYRVQTTGGVTLDRVNVTVVPKPAPVPYVKKTTCVPFGSGIKCTVNARR